MTAVRPGRGRDESPARVVSHAVGCRPSTHDLRACAVLTRGAGYFLALVGACHSGPGAELLQQIDERVAAAQLTTADVRQIGFPCTSTEGIVPIIAPVSIPVMGSTLTARYNLDYAARSQEQIDCWVWLSQQEGKTFLGDLGMADHIDPLHSSPEQVLDAALGCRAYLVGGSVVFLPAGFVGQLGVFSRLGNRVDLAFALPLSSSLLGTVMVTQFMVRVPGSYVTSNAVAFTIGG